MFEWDLMQLYLMIAGGGCVLIVFMSHLLPKARCWLRKITVVACMSYAPLCLCPTHTNLPNLQGHNDLFALLSPNYAHQSATPAATTSWPGFQASFPVWPIFWQTLSTCFLENLSASWHQQQDCVCLRSSRYGLCSLSALSSLQVLPNWRVWHAACLPPATTISQVKLHNNFTCHLL